MPIAHYPSASCLHLPFRDYRSPFGVQLQIQEGGGLCTLGCTVAQRKPCKWVESRGSLDCSKCLTVAEPDYLGISSRCSWLSPAGTRIDTRYWGGHLTPGIDLKGLGNPLVELVRAWVWRQEAWFSTLAPLLTGCGVLGKLLCHSESQFPHV